MRAIAARLPQPGPVGNRRTGLLLYNGATTGSTYQIGSAVTFDNLGWTKLSTDRATITPGPASWDSAYVKDPLLLKIGPGDYRCWYAGGSSGASGAQQIGYAASRDGLNWSKYPGSPVIAHGGSGAWDEFTCEFPIVLYEPSDVSKPFKMWYAGSAVATPSKLQIGYAYSTDGLTWTKSGSNPVLTVGAGGSYDAVGVIGGSIINVAGTYNLFYNGWPSSASITQAAVCLATFTAPEGTYTKSGSNPLLSPSAASQSLTSNLSIGSATVAIGSTTGFHAGEPCLLRDTTGAVADVFIQSVDNSTQLTLTKTVPRAWTTANTAAICSLYYGSINGRTLQSSGGTYTMYGVAYQQFGSNELQERSIAATSSALGSGWAFDYTRGFVLPLGSFWDTLSAENPSVVLE